MKKLIVAADDFGLTKSVNEGIVKAHKEGIVTCLNFLPSGDAFEDALRLAKEIGLKEAGAHLALTETSPSANPSKIPTLVADGNRFYKGHGQFLRKLLFGKIDLDQVYIELKSQLDRVEGSGVRITNLSSHEHIHMMPEILDIFVKLAKEYDIPAIRYPHGDYSSSPYSLRKIYKRTILSCLAGSMTRTMRASGIISPDHFLGFLDSGKLTEDIVLGMLGFLAEGTTELVCHPGFLGPEVLDRYAFHKNCEAELFALTSRRVKKLINERGIKLVSYGEFISG